MNAPEAPIAYAPDLEVPDDDERATAEALAKTFTDIQRTTYADEGHALRGVHAKAHGLLKAKLEVSPNLPRVLAQGIFSRPATYPSIMRFSTSPGDLMSDKVSTPRGLAIKIIGVDGERLTGAEGAQTQDFLFVNGPTFSAPNAKVFLANLKMLAATTDKAEGAKQALSAALRATEAAIETVGGKSATVKSLGGEPARHILGQTYFSQLPQRFGDHIAKLQIAPVSPDLTALTDAKADLGESDDILREQVVAFFQTNTAVWELRAQLCVDLERMPIEEASKKWDEKLSPFVTIASITAEPQPAWSEERDQTMNDGLAFSPWQGVEAHRPLGSIMRMRKLAYERSKRFRAERSDIPVAEPHSIDQIAG